MKTWIVVADASRARIFETNGAKDGLREVHAFVHPASRMKTSELVSDRPGRVNRGSGRAAMEARTSAHDVQANDFARLLAKTLDAALERGEFGPVILLAPPHFLGQLRAVVSNRVLDAVTETVQKDFTEFSVEELATRIGELLPAAAYAW